MKIRLPHIRRNRSGFSLLELTVVVVIIGLMSLVAVGSYSVMKQKRNLRGAASSLNSAFVTARSYAITTNRWHRVVLQMNTSSPYEGRHSFWIDEIDFSSNTIPNPGLPEPAVRSKITTPQMLPVGVHFLDANVNGTTYTASLESNIVIRFFPNGSSDQATVRLYEDSTAANRPTPVTTVKLFPATAKTRIITDDGT